MGKSKEEVKAILTANLNDCLSYVNREGAFKVLECNLETKKFIVEFDIVEFNILEVESDNYVGFAGY